MLMPLKETSVSSFLFSSVFYNEYQLYYYIRLFFFFCFFDVVIVVHMIITLSVPSSFPVLFFAVRCVLVYMLVIFFLFSSSSLCAHAHNVCKPSHTELVRLFLFSCSSMAPRRLSSRNFFFFSCLVLAHFLLLILSLSLVRL